MQETAHRLSTRIGSDRAELIGLIVDWLLSLGDLHSHAFLEIDSINDLTIK